MSDPELSLSERILEAFACRLAQVVPANGYRTDAGLRVLRARTSIAESETPCFNVRGARTSASNASGGSQSMDLVKTVTVEFHAKANKDETGEMLERGLADGKRAVLSNENGGIADRIGKLVSCVTYVGDESLPRADGDVTESVTMTFDVHYKEAYGNPYAVR